MVGDGEGDRFAEDFCALAAACDEESERAVCGGVRHVPLRRDGRAQGAGRVRGRVARPVAPGLELDGAERVEPELDLPRLPQPNGSVVGAAGATWNFQAWYRDANPLGSNLSEAVEVRFSP